MLPKAWRFYLYIIVIGTAQILSWGFANDHTYRQTIHHFCTIIKSHLPLTEVLWTGTKCPGFSAFVVYIFVNPLGNQLFHNTPLIILIMCRWWTTWCTKNSTWNFGRGHFTYCPSKLFIDIINNLWFSDFFSSYVNLGLFTIKTNTVYSTRYDDVKTKWWE